jgi:hypothetical protein
MGAKRDYGASLAMKLEMPESYHGYGNSSLNPLFAIGKSLQVAELHP